MSDLASQIDEARKNGYSDQEILDHIPTFAPTLSPKILEAKSHGYSPTEIADFLKTQPQQSGTGSPGIDAFVNRVTTESPLNPENWGKMLQDAFTSHPELQDEFARAYDTYQKTGKFPVSDAPKKSTGVQIGEGAGDLVNGLLTGLILHAGVSGVKAGASKIQAMRGINQPDLALVQAANPHTADTDFLQAAPDIRASMKRGEAITGKPIVDVPSAIEAAEASMKEHMQALEPSLQNARIDPTKVLPTAKIKSNAIDALPPGLKTQNPTEYDAAVKEINSLFPGKDHLNVDEVMDQAHLNNSQLSSFHAGNEKAQNSKLVTNGGDTAVLKAMGDTYRQWISDNLGAVAADVNSKWGELNGIKHYLQNRLIPSAKEMPITALESAASHLGITPSALLRPDKSILGTMFDSAMGRPQTINGMLKGIFDKTEPGMAPMEADIKYPVARSERLLTSGDVITPPPADASSVHGVPAMVQPPNPARALPASPSVIITPEPADTSFVRGASGNPYEKPMITEGGGAPKLLESHEAKQPKITPTDASVEGQRGVQPTSTIIEVLKDPNRVAKALYGRDYSQIGSVARADVDSVVQGRRGLKLHELLKFGQ